MFFFKKKSIRIIIKFDLKFKKKKIKRRKIFLVLIKMKKFRKSVKKFDKKFKKKLLLLKL